MSGAEVAGIIDRRANRIAVAQKFGFETMRFTGAHEIGHWYLHETQKMHRDPPVRGIWTERGPREPVEEEADFFAACFLIPAGLLRREVRHRFGTECVALDDVTAAKLGEVDAEAFFSKTRRDRALMIAATTSRAHFDPLATQFAVSLWTMAYRLIELDLVE